MSVIVFVGATSGLGARAARQLARQGHTLRLVGRDVRRGERQAGETDSRFVPADVSTLDGVDAVATGVADLDRIDVLVNNAGVMTPKREVTSEGFELNFAVHHLAPFSLTGRLLPQLRRGAGRVVNVSSAGHHTPLRGSGPVRLDFADLQSATGFDPFLTYSRTKLANLLFTYELHRRHPELTVAALHPGMVRTSLARQFPRLQVAALSAMLPPASHGAKPVVHLATAPDIGNGQYFDRFTPTRSSAASYDEDTASRLWTITEQLRGPFARQEEMS